MGNRTHAGLTRHLDVGLRLTAPSGAAAALAKSLASLLDEVPTVPVRLAGAGTDHGRVVLTVAITLGSIEDVKASSPAAEAALGLMRQIVTSLAGYDPAFAVLPDAESAEAMLARRLVEAGTRSGLLSQMG